MLPNSTFEKQGFCKNVQIDIPFTMKVPPQLEQKAHIPLLIVQQGRGWGPSLLNFEKENGRQCIK